MAKLTTCPVAVDGNPLNVQRSAPDAFEGLFRTSDAEFKAVSLYLVRIEAADGISGAERYEVDEVYQRVDLVQFEPPHKTAAQCFGGRTVTAGIFAATLVGFAGGGDGGLLFDAFRGFTCSQFAGESVDFPPQLCVVCGVGYLRHDGNALKGGAEALNLFG